MHIGTTTRAELHHKQLPRAGAVVQLRVFTPRAIHAQNESEGLFYPGVSP